MTLSLPYWQLKVIFDDKISRLRNVLSVNPMILKLASQKEILQQGMLVCSKILMEAPKMKIYTYSQLSRIQDSQLFTDIQGDDKIYSSCQFSAWTQFVGLQKLLSTHKIYDHLIAMMTH